MIKNKKSILFYLTLVYLLSFLFWWTYLLYNKTGIHYEDSLKYEILKHTNSGKAIDTYLNSDIYTQQLKKFKREKIMIITEGLVFSLILIFLVYKVKKSIDIEIDMSKQQQNFILSITHELKSPLSSIKLMSQTLAKHELKKEQKNKLIENSLEEVKRLESLVDNILLAAKLDNNKYGFLKKELNLTELVENLVSRSNSSSYVNIKSEIDNDIYIDADKDGMTSIITNIIENAIKYSDKQSLINVILKQKKKSIYFIVKDLGIGIDDSLKEKVFNKFYRVGNEETRASKGTGLGLHIVKRLVTFHNGTIHILDNKPNGSIFEIIFQQ